MAEQFQVCLGQGVIDIVSNEITGVEKLLEFLELTNAVFRLDGRHCQNETAEAIRDKAVGSVLTVTAVIRRAKTSPPSAPKTGRRVGVLNRRIVLFGPVGKGHDLGLRALRSADGEPPCPADSVRLCTLTVHLPVRPWSPRSQGFPREADAGRTEAPRRLAATSVAAPRRPRFTRSGRRTSRVGSSGGKPPSGPCRGYVEDELRGYLECGLLCFSLRPAGLHGVPHPLLGTRQKGQARMAQS